MRQTEEEAIRKLFQSVGPDITSPPGSQERMLRRLLDETQARESALAGQSRRRWRDYRWITRLSPVAAATILVAIAVWCLLGGNVERASAGFSEVLKRINQATTVAYDAIWRVPEPGVKYHIIMASGRTRVTWPDGRIHIFDDVQHVGLGLTPATMTARLMQLTETSDHEEPLDSLRKAEVSAGHFVGKETLNGKTLDVYNVDRKQEIMRVWVDPEEELPIRIEVREADRLIVTLDNFRWNMSVPDSLFSLEVPAGYTLAQSETAPSEGNFIEFLRICAARTGGGFPAELDARTVLDLFLEKDQDQNVYRRTVHAGETATFTDMDDQVSEDYRICLRGLAFVEQISENGTWRYAGAGVRLGEKAAPVCWWRLAGSATFRVVYGNLEIKNMAADMLPIPIKQSAPKLKKESGSFRK